MKIVCLIGSTRHKEAFERATLAESLAGNIVLSVACFQHADGIELSDSELKTLHDLHRRKISMADEVLVINIDHYLGGSTLDEMEHAGMLGKEIRFLEHKAILT